MAHAKEEVEYFVLTPAEHDLFLDYDENGYLAPYFVQFAEVPGMWCIPAATVRGCGDENFTEEFLMDFDTRFFVMSTMHPI